MMACYDNAVISPKDGEVFWPLSVNGVERGGDTCICGPDFNQTKTTGTTL